VKETLKSEKEEQAKEIERKTKLVVEAERKATALHGQLDEPVAFGRQFNKLAEGLKEGINLT
jgi:hypothetical protein